MRCFAIIMAAGFSERFGNGNKLLVPFRGKPLVCHTLDLICAMPRFERVFVVYADEKVAALARPAMAAGRPVSLIYNPAPEKGQGESALLGVKAADRAAAASGEEPVYYLFLPGDQPLLDAGTVSVLLDAAKPGCIVQPGPNSPTLFSASFRDELFALKPGEHPRLLKSRYPHAVITVEPPDPAVLADIDTQSDWERLEAIR